MPDYSLYTNEDEVPSEGFVLKKTRAKSKGGTLTTDVQPGQAVLPAAMAALVGRPDYRQRAAELFQQGSDMFNAEPDMTQYQEYAKRQGESGQAATLNALAAQFAGEGFQPLQSQFLKRAAAAQEPMKVAGGLLTPEGQFLRDPVAAQEKKAEFLLQQAKAYEQMAQTADTARERLAAKRESDALMNQIRLMGLQIQGMNAQTARMNAQGAQMKPPANYEWGPMEPDGSRTLKPIKGGPADQKITGAFNADTAALNSSLDALNRLEASAHEVEKHPGLSRITGVAGVFPNYPGGNAANAQADLKKLASQSGFAVLQALRDASKTGGALGQVSNFEIQQLQNNLASLDQAQSYDQIVKEIQKIQEFAEGARGRLRDAYNMKHGGGAAPVAPASNGGFDAEKERRYQEWKKTQRGG